MLGQERVPPPGQLILVVEAPNLESGHGLNASVRFDGGTVFDDVFEHDQMQNCLVPVCMSLHLSPDMLISNFVATKGRTC